MYGAMWSEHCSYKSSKIHLRTLPTEGAAVLVGPGQDAGAVDVGDGVAVVFKMESHSHPSAIEPYQGAATGVGGIVRDIVSMGARPVALLDPLMFGPLTDERNRWLLEGVVAGIGGYGNCIGVPTVGGEIRFAEPHSANPSVNVMCVGLAQADALVTATSHTRARGIAHGPLRRGDRVATGSAVCRVLASATLDDGARGVAPERADRRPVRGEAADRGVARADRGRPARGPAGPRRRRHHVRGERVGGARRHGRRPRPRRGAAPGARAWSRSRSSRADRRSGCSRSCAANARRRPRGLRALGPGVAR